MTRLLDHLPDDQKKAAGVIRNEWRARDIATDQNCFQVGKQLQELLGEECPYFAQVAHNKKYASSAPKNVSRGPATDKTPYGFAHSKSNGHSWADCFSKPINAQLRSFKRNSTSVPNFEVEKVPAQKTKPTL